MTTKPLWITAYDDRFEEMYSRHFIRSFNRLDLDKDFELEVHKLSHEYGTYGDKRYNSSYRAELQAVVDILKENLGREIVWTDVDIHMYRNPLEDMRTLLATTLPRIWCQMDSDTVFCTGFQFFICTQEVIDFFETWTVITDSKEWHTAQDSFNEAIKLQPDSFGKLPSHRYWTVGMSGRKEVWDGQSILTLPSPPKDIVMHHGNFTIGLENKLLLMDVIERSVRGL
jgi:hypothetical protein